MTDSTTLLKQPSQMTAVLPITDASSTDLLLEDSKYAHVKCRNPCCQKIGKTNALFYAKSLCNTCVTWKPVKWQSHEVGYGTVKHQNEVRKFGEQLEGSQTTDALFQLMDKYHTDMQVALINWNGKSTSSKWWKQAAVACNYLEACMAIIHERMM